MGYVYRNENVNLLDNMEYLGFKVLAEGIHRTESKIEAIIRQVRCPTDVSDLRSFVGLVNYYSRFEPNLAHHMAPLYVLMKKGESWKWAEIQNKAFTKIKQLITENVVLHHYSQDSELVLTCDASFVGLGMVLETRMSDGSMRPICFCVQKSNQTRKTLRTDRAGSAFCHHLWSTDVSSLSSMTKIYFKD